jgi:hypothetical protein
MVKLGDRANAGNYRLPNNRRNNSFYTVESRKAVERRRLLPTVGLPSAFEKPVFAQFALMIQPFIRQTISFVEPTA